MLLEAIDTYLPWNHSTSCTFAGYQGFAALLRGSWSSAKLCLLRVGAKLQENNTAWTQQQHHGKKWWASEEKLFWTSQGSKQQSSGLSFRFLELLPPGFCNSSLPQPGSAFQQQLGTASQRLLCHQHSPHPSPSLAWLAHSPPTPPCRAWAGGNSSNISFPKAQTPGASHSTGYRSPSAPSLVPCVQAGGWQCGAHPHFVPCPQPEAVGSPWEQVGHSKLSCWALINHPALVLLRAGHLQQILCDLRASINSWGTWQTKREWIFLLISKFPKLGHALVMYLSGNTSWSLLFPLQVMIFRRWPSSGFFIYLPCFLLKTVYLH